MKASQRNAYQPTADETLGAYLKRLREAAGQAQGRTISQDMVAEMAAHLPTPQRFTGAWLSVAEADGYKQPGGDKLRTLAWVYAQLLGASIRAEWLLQKAGFALEGLPDAHSLDRLLQHEDVLALIAIVGRLIELGYEDDVRLLVTLAHRYLDARNPQARASDIFDDSELSAHVERYMTALGLT